MDLVPGGSVLGRRRLSPLIASLASPRPSVCPRCAFPFTKCPYPSPYSANISLTSHAKKRDTYAQPVPKQTTTRAEEEERVEEEFMEDFEDEIMMDDTEDFEDDFEVEYVDLNVGDGAEGGGISLAGTWWDKEALLIAEEVSMLFDGDLKIYAFKTSTNLTIRLRIEKLSSKYGSPCMSDIEAFSTAYQSHLDEAELAGKIPKNISLEVSSPGVERVVRVPEELERFKDLPMYVKYSSINAETALTQENDGVFKLISFDLDLCQCTWGLADVRINRQQAGKGRPLSRKQREWQLQTPFESLSLVRLYSDC
ncbi:uncharacterized protein LOC103711048 [Phoenix dactylifera]|uniref:Uncharacterized protein LOC103711048 n=1 Tax=Phoenix dactylifera TaxID=42345 RepID=A0A8B7CAT9_PHODC|nr:uncharacterized protein LOC103711048 [Phoenix dactylifera]